MGGLAGWIATPRRMRDERALIPMLEAIAHRCTGDSAMCAMVDRGARHEVVLGARLHDPVAGLSIALDGSIENRRELHAQLAGLGYRFAGESAPEVVLRAYQRWDKDMVKHLRGPFAIALWDARKEQLLLARDRFGEKPLFVRESGGALFFASEIKALLRAPEVPPQVDLAGVRDCLAQGFVSGPGTLLAGVRKLAPATCALWQLGRLHEVRYWLAPDRDRRLPGQATADEASAVDGFIACLGEALALQRESADGLFLSGGLDSAVLAALAVRQGGRLKTFSLGWEGDRRSELAAAAQAAKHFGTEHHEIVVSARELATALPRVVALRGAPLARPSDLAFHRLAAEASPRARGVLTGEGCDEVLGGYRRHAAGRFAWSLSGYRDRPGPALRDALCTLEAPGASRAGRPPFDADPRASRLRRILYFEQTGRLPDDLLERGDRIGMAASLELRSPYLDHRLAELVSGYPDRLRVRGMTTKWVLRQAGRRLLPPALQRRPKRGFRLPLAGWLRTELSEMVREHLSGSASLTRRYYDAALLDRVVDEHLRARKNHEHLLWTLLNLEIWHRTRAGG
ncbi:MAG TPA: asparagine synthase (glutamine-hydrolyzing) [Burkholderiales bacterium]|nr:asparagine synthase (glutamine-hydrolyzing) [Burkholderiales bacterium]